MRNLHDAQDVFYILIRRFTCCPGQHVTHFVRQNFTAARATALFSSKDNLTGAERKTDYRNLYLTSHGVCAAPEG